MDPQKQTEIIEKLNQLVILLEKNQSIVQTGSAAQILLALVPVIAIVFGSALLFFFVLWNYKLKRELIKSGQYTHTTVQNLRMLSLLMGIMSTAVGFPMTILFSIIEGINYMLLGGVIPMFVGIGLLVFYIFSRKSEAAIPKKRKR